MNGPRLHCSDGERGLFSVGSRAAFLLDEVLSEIDADPDAGPKLRAAAAPLRLEFTDLKLKVDIAAAEKPDHCLEWSFRGRAEGSRGCI